MNPDALTDQFDLYLAVLETGSFSAAARRLQLTPSSVARRIDALEKAMGCVLVARNTHAVRATAAGLAFAERARRILAELRQARAEAVSLSSAPEGLIRIDAPAPFGRRHLAPAIADFLTLYPGLDVQLRLIDSFVDLHGDHLGEVDLVLRIGPLADTRLVATPLASMTRILCASPEYVRRRGLLRDPRELPQHDGLDWDALSPPHAWRFEVEGRLQLLRPGRLRMTANNAETLLFSALAGLIGGLIAIRSKGVYFALISFGLAQVVSKFVYNTRELGASDGIIGVPAASLAPGVTSGTPEVFFLLVLSFIGALYLGLRYLMNTPMGRQLDAIRINEHRVSFLGVDAWRYKLGAFVAAACIAGLSGALYPMLRGFVSPELMFFQVSGNAVINVIVGGTGTLIGPLYGSAILTGLRSVVGSFTAHHHIVIGVMFVVVVIVMPRGLIGYTTPLLQRWLDRRQAPAKERP